MIIFCLCIVDNCANLHNLAALTLSRLLPNFVENAITLPNKGQHFAKK